MVGEPLHGPVDVARVSAALRAGDVDAAIDAGLMQLGAAEARSLSGEERALVQATRQRLQAAWDARERHRARAARLARIAAEREARRTRPAASVSKPPLPPAAASALARALAKASGKP